MKTCDRSRLAPSASVLLIISALAWLAGCASPTVGFQRIEHPERPIQRTGFVLYLPSEGTWSMAESDEEGLTRLLFKQDLGAPTESGKIQPTTAISVEIAHTPAERFAELYPNQHAALEAFSTDAAKPSTGRFKDLSSDTTWGQVQGQEFARVARRCEERDNPIDPSAVLVLDASSTWLFHPNRPVTCMWVLITHRGHEGQPMPSIADLEKQFFSKLAFE